MAGRRRGRGPGGTTAPKRPDLRVAEHERRIATAQTGRQQAAAAFDRWRSAAVRLDDAGTELNEVATWLNERAKQAERRS
jgi:hypothetical protein